jgi:hypothetical protein
MAVELSSFEKKIHIQGHGIKITTALKQQIYDEGFYPIALTWIGDDVTGPFSFSGYGDDSPFELRKVDDQYHVFQNGKFYTEVTFYRRPEFWSHQFDFGAKGSSDSKSGINSTVFIDEGMAGVITPCGQSALDFDDDQGDVLKLTRGRFPFVSVACYNGLSSWPSWGCMYTKAKQPCKFCCIPGAFDESKILYTQEGWLEGLAETFVDVEKELGEDIRECSYTIDAGTLPGSDKGANVYIKVLDAIKNRLGHLPKTYYIRAVIEPPHGDEWLYALKEAGFTDIQMDVDIYDDEERRRLMPNAKGYRPIADYLKAFQKAKEIFPGEVATQLIAGIQSDENLLKGVEQFASLGVPTLVTPFLPFGQGRKLIRDEEEIDVPTPDRMLHIYERAAASLTRHNVDAPGFRGGVSSLPEFMGKRKKRAGALTNYQKGAAARVLEPALAL